jgi:hypothetical protein
MRSQVLSILSVLGLAAAVTEAEAPPAEQRSTPDVLVRMELIEVSHAVLSTLMADPQLVRDGTLLRMRLQELAMEGEAANLETMMVRGAGPEACAAHSGREWIYPTEPGPPANPNIIRTGGLFEPPILKNPLFGHLPPHPRAFTMRRAGSSLSAQIDRAEAGGRIDFNYHAEFVLKTGEKVHLHQRKADGNEYGFRTPVFELIAPSNRLVVQDGRYVLAETGSREGAPDKKVLVLVRADVVGR